MSKLDKIILIILCFILIAIVTFEIIYIINLNKPKGANNTYNVIKIIDKSKLIEGFACAEALEGFYSDDNYEYFYECIKGRYVVVLYDNGYEETVSKALANKRISIEDLDRFNIHYYKDEKVKYYPISTLNCDYASTEVLVKFENSVYGKSFKIIDYAGGKDFVCQVEKLIDSSLVPALNLETNTKELLGAKIFYSTDNSIVLLYNNEYVLFEKI